MFKTKNMDLNQLFEESRSCQRCFKGKEIYVPQPDPKNSIEKAEILFINERPGRIGTGQSGYISFDNDDPSANFFKECFEHIGLNRENIAITNACLCHPVFEGYTDTAPKIREIKNCHYWLQKQVEITQPKLIVTLGRVAYESILRYFNKWPVRNSSSFLGSVGEVIKDTNTWVYPLAHTSRLGRVNRKAEVQIADWERIPKILMELQNET
jgi:uracil-DNA glycosylase family 4